MIDQLKKTDVCFLGAIKAKPKEEAQMELASELQGKSFVYTSPFARLRQEFNLRTNLRPCKAFSGNPLTYRDDIDLEVFRENTEDLYAGVDFHTFPQEVMDTPLKNHENMQQ